MKLFRKYQIKVAFILGIVLLFSSCSQYNDNITENNYETRDVFKSVFFANGQFAKKIDSYKLNIEAINSLEKKQIDFFNKNVDILLDKIETENPDFFEYFKTEIFSKNHQRIENAITKGAEYIYNDMDKIYPNMRKVVSKVRSDYDSGKILTNGKIDDKKIEKQISEYESLLVDNMITSEITEVQAFTFAAAVVSVIYFLVAIHNSVAITVLAVAALAIKVKVGAYEFELSPQSKNKDMLEYEILIDDIAKADLN